MHNGNTKRSLPIPPAAIWIEIRPWGLSSSNVGSVRRPARRVHLFWWLSSDWWDQGRAQSPPGISSLSSPQLETSILKVPFLSSWVAVARSCYWPRNFEAGPLQDWCNCWYACSFLSSWSRSPPGDGHLFGQILQGSGRSHSTSSGVAQGWCRLLLGGASTSVARETETCSVVSACATSFWSVSSSGCVCRRIVHWHWCRLISRGKIDRVSKLRNATFKLRMSWLVVQFGLMRFR